MVEVTVPMDDAALFAAATGDSPPVAETPAAPAADTAAPESTAESQGDQITGEQPRDERGRFAAKAEEPPAPETPLAPQEPVRAQAQPDAIPPWRLREEADARRAAEGRASDLERQLHQAVGQLRQFTEKKEDPADPIANPELFHQQKTREAIDPLTRQMDGMREFFSQQFAFQQHGQHVVTAAYRALGDAMAKGDRTALLAFERMGNSLHPFGDMVTWYKQQSVLSTIGDDPEKWFEAQLAERAKDPAKRQQLVGLLGGQAPPANAQQQPANNVVKLPPSLSGVRSTPTGETTGASDADLYAFATR